ncbi:tetratricopeptide repeat protein [Clostridium perfringens]|uniref:tetratricopeptide repeat protein n=1 Tax=Clostridium perfringens TaxID=1502 RepID=UPI001A1A2417|nr:tetratricopeptide repeat protein [Clostridium perfringens]EHK2442603.1 tetratricopeptide repeat protein [Clostridium perfringens]MDT9337503.1 tetratricopeptide repeat protein [Clostridium perfringens]MDT9345260.1 tetratricopeptide repeat protein [Clostridium perfringens]MDT9348503.1 tetratricopeptide repeat protein [Clostridium perfringens]MDT9354346.1 tetratricopeptide repeat protein [Clostridium perfringens]
MIDYFKELNIQIDASDNEVKNAYFNMTKKYPPEKFPKEYRVIRDAYETLIDKSKRDAYILDTFDIEIRNILNEGIDLAKSEKYDLAVVNFEKVLQRYPDNSKVKKDLAVCLMRGRNYKKSSKILKELVIREPNNIEYYKLLINAYRENYDIKNLESVLKKSLKLKNVEVDFYLKLFEIYNESELRDYTKAVMVLKDGLENKNINSQKYKLYLKFLDLSDRLDCKDDFNKGCEALSEITLRDNYEEVKISILNLLDRILKEFHFKNGVRLTSTALVLIDEKKDMGTLEKIMSLRRTFLELSRLYEDKSINEDFKKVVFFNAVSKFLKDDIEFNKDFERINQNFFNNFNFENDELVKSIGKLKNDYRNVYLETRKLSDKVLGRYSKVQKIKEENNVPKEFYSKRREGNPVKILFRKVINSFRDK